jgi:hypothetical protein
MNFQVAKKKIVSAIGTYFGKYYGKKSKPGEESRTKKKEDGTYLINGYPVRESVYPLTEWFENAKTN